MLGRRPPPASLRRRRTLLRRRPGSTFRLPRTDPAAAPPCRPGPGEGRFLLSDLVTAPGQTLTVPLADRAGRPLPGCVAELSAEELPGTNALVTLALAASRLDNLDVFGKSDPFVIVSKARESGWVPVLKTEVRL